MALGFGACSFPHFMLPQISNSTLWLESADGMGKFTFRLSLAPLNDRLLLQQQSDEEEGGGNNNGRHKRVPLGLDDTFRSEDILRHRLEIGIFLFWAYIFGIFCHKFFVDFICLRLMSC
jgi:hypothetical protein